MKKKLIAWLLCFMMAGSLTACGGAKEPEQDAGTESRSEEHTSELQSQR